MRGTDKRLANEQLASLRPKYSGARTNTTMRINKIEAFYFIL